MPKRKVVVSAVAGAIVTLGVFVEGVLKGPAIDPAASAAAVVIVSTILAYVIPEADQA